jgi:isocitrate dehydrogenase
VASIFAWSGGLRHRGTLDNNAALVKFADDLEAAVRETIEGGCVTHHTPHSSPSAVMGGDLMDGGLLAARH